MNISKELLFGKTESHLAPLSGTHLRLHKEVIKPFTHLQKKAKTAGFQLEIASGFRSFESQLNIWNKKAAGTRPLLDANGKPLKFESLSPKEIMFSILRWSALPGTSRHHWGTDFDVYDAGSIPAGYQLQLVPSEVEAGGMFSKLHDWLDKEMGAFGFFRPFSKDRGGVSPERWHLSYAPLSTKFLNAFDLPTFELLLAETAIALIDVVRMEKNTVYARYLQNVEPTLLLA